VVTAIAGLALLVDLVGSAQLSPAGIMWGLGEAVSLAVYFLLSAAVGEAVLPPLVMAWGGLRWCLRQRGQVEGVRHARRCPA
jgi:threonine/homoserine efflux transporter RhtA